LSDRISSRPYYSDQIVENDGRFTEEFNKFLDELVRCCESGGGSGGSSGGGSGEICIDLGSRITGDAVVEFGSRI